MLSLLCSLFSLCSLFVFCWSTKQAWVGLRLETPAWWLIGLAISARNGLGLRFAVGNAGVVVVAWACDLGVVVAWACRSCRFRPGFADLSHATKHELHPAGQALPCRSQRSGGGAVPISAEGVGGKDLFGWLFLVAEKFHLWWFLVAEKFHLWFVVVFCCWEIKYCGGFWLLWLIYGGCGGGGVGRITAVGYFWWETIIQKSKKYNI